MSMVEKIAAIIDPTAFKSRDQLFRFCISNGDAESDAHETADWAHGAQCKEAMIKARAAIEAMMEPTPEMLAAGEGEDTFMANGSLVERADAAHHYGAMIQAALKEGQE